VVEFAYHIWHGTIIGFAEIVNCDIFWQSVEGCLWTKHLERASDLHSQHRTVDERIPSRTEDILFPQRSRDQARSRRPPAIRAHKHPISELNWT